MRIFGVAEGKNPSRLSKYWDVMTLGRRRRRWMSQETGACPSRGAPSTGTKLAAWIYISEDKDTWPSMIVRL